MIDVHTHILPCVDDGATNDDMAISMLDILEKSGVTDVFLTPHFYSDVESLADFVAKRDDAYNTFKNIYHGKLNLHLGAEVYLTKYLSTYEDLSAVCFDQTGYILVEFPFDKEISEDTNKILESLIYNYKLTPIVAHIERYPFFYHDNDVIDDLISIGCLIQVNSDSFISKRMKKVLLSLVKEGKVNFIGSDSHNLTDRPPTYSQAMEVIRSKLGESCLKSIHHFENVLIGLADN